MRPPEINPAATAFAIAAGCCYVVIKIMFEFMRKRANDTLPPQERISWLLSGARRRAIIAKYNTAHPQGWEYHAYRISRALWVTFVILGILALFFG
jgi:hypothetical protein